MHVLHGPVPNFLCPSHIFFSHLFSGALNHQTTHHLFPGISQYYYPQITPIIKKTCQEFGVRYNFKETFTQALGAHVHHLKALGQAAEQPRLRTRQGWECATHVYVTLPRLTLQMKFQMWQRFVPFARGTVFYLLETDSGFFAWRC